MAEEKEEITCECQEIHEDLLKIVNETMPDEEELYDLADLFKVLQTLLVSVFYLSCLNPKSVSAIWQKS